MNRLRPSSYFRRKERQKEAYRGRGSIGLWGAPGAMKGGCGWVNGRSAKPTEHFRSTPGGYFPAMVTKAKQGHLNLDRTIWKLRSDRKDSQPRPPQVRPGGGYGRDQPV